MRLSLGAASGAASLAGMVPRWERIAGPPALEQGALFMDAVLRPNRSLSLPAFKLMLIVVIVINAGVAAAFIAQGALPVAGFLGLDVLALWIAFRANYASGRAEERLRVGAGQVHLERRDPRGASTHWVLNPVWARVSHDDRGVLIQSGGGALRVAAFLSPDERAAFAEAVSAALWRAKRGY